MDFEHWDRFYRANFFNSLGGFKSLNLLGTRSASGQENLGLFFSVIHIGAHPPLVGVLFRPHTVPRHTLENIYDTKELTLNAVSRGMVRQAHQCAAKYERGVSEFEATGLTPWYSKAHKAPYVKQSLLKAGCTFVEKQHIQANDTILLIAKIREVYLEEKAIAQDGFIHHEQLQTVSVNGLDAYYTPKLIERLVYPRPDAPVKKREDD